MKSLLFKAALTLAFAPLLFCSSARAQDNDGCTNRTLRGDYAFTVFGELFLPTGPNTFQTVQRQGVAMTHFDGVGNLSQVDLVLSDPNAPPPPGVPPVDPVTGFHNEETGTYTVNKDCTGTFTIDFPPFTDPKTGKMTPGAIITAHFVLSDHGRAIHTVVTSLTPPGAPKPVPALIRSEGYKLDRGLEF
jgi:hypothetical protein